MNIQEMHTAFKVELDKTNALELPAFEPEEIDYWLNRAIFTYVKQMYRHLFERNEEASEALRTLIRHNNYIVAPGIPGQNKPNSYIADLSGLLLNDELLYIIDEEADIIYQPIDQPGVDVAKTQGVTPCTHNEYRYKVEDPHSEHRLHYGEAKPLRLYYDDLVELVTDGNYSVGAYRLRYITPPAVVDIVNDISCDLPLVTHDEIVKLAVRMALENIEQPRYRSYVAEEKLEQ